MEKLKVSVCSNREALITELREKCASYEFEVCEGVSKTSVVIIDAGSDAKRVPDRGADVVRIILTDDRSTKREFGEIRLPEAAFLDCPEEWLAVAGDLAGVQIRNDGLEESASLDQRVRELLLINDLDAVFERVSLAIVELLGASEGWLFIHEPAREVFALVFGSEKLGPILPHEIVEKLHAVYAVESPHLFEAGHIALPIFANEDLIGAFVGEIPSEPEEGEIERSLQYLDAVTAVISNARHVSENRDLALRDDLTKAYNRRFFESYLDEEIERTRRYGSVFSIIFLDLDNLKRINNKHGHLIGSRVLQEVAKRVLSAVRTIDKVVRFGGDEFCIILPETDKDQAKSVAFRVRQSMTKSSFHIEADIIVAITASFGIASYPNHALTKEGLIRQADEAMYRVKSTTKNAIGVAGDPGMDRTETAAS